ncbi:MAG: hypothetical protein JWQ09_3777 [Segetibacter sp.]|nr:hypothetical protein [Segetibacter sp.]
MLLLTRIQDKIRRIFENKAIVLMYHRIADVQIDPWQLAVSPKNFEEHLQVLTHTFKIVPVDSLIRNVKTKSISAKSVAITFDDGYSDNYYYAKPLLEKYGCPATFFIASYFTGKEKEYWWDELESILLHSPRLPQTLCLEINDFKLEYHLGNSEGLTDEERLKQSRWKWPEVPPTKRCELYLKVWEHLKPLLLAEIDLVLKELREWAKTAEVHKESFPMTEKQVIKLGSNSLFNVGVHSFTHPALSLHCRDVQYKEIAESKSFLQNSRVNFSNTMAYPYGNYNDETISVVREQKFDAAFTTEELLITRRSNMYKLGRFQVNNWDGEEFEKQLYKWFKSY